MAEARTEHSEETAVRTRPRVLLVDDDRRLVAMLGESLKLRLPDAQIDQCCSGAEALQRIDGADYDVVVSDCLMPGINGLELLDRIRVQSPHSLTMLVTGASDRELTLRAMRAGAYDFIHKPVDSEYFAASVRRAIETSRLRREVERQQVVLRQHAEELERTVEERTRELQDAHRMKDAFLATLSHELLTPLTAILGWARLARSGILDETTRAQAIESIHRNAKAQAQLIDELLDISRIITGKLRLEVKQVDVPSLLDHAVDTMLPAARAKMITIDTVLPKDDLDPISADPDRLQQVFWNLLSNAIKFTDEGGRVVVRLERIGAQLEVTVTDNGAGISESLLPYVFERLRQGSPTGHDPSRRGLGIGLAIVRYLVELHGGTVEAVSAGPGQGSTFRVRLPYRPAVTQLVELPNLAQPEARIAGPDSLRNPPILRGVRVLLVEDEFDARELVGFILRQAGAQVTAVGSSAEGLQAFDAGPPDVVLCDIGLPDEDGHSFMMKVRRRSPERGGNVPAIAFTAYARPEDVNRAKAAGFQLHLAKPGPPNLTSIIAELLANGGIADSSVAPIA